MDWNRQRPREDERYLLALNALQSVLFLIARHTEVLVVLWDEALGADGLLAAAADEAGLMPAAVFVLHLAGTCHESWEEAAKGRADDTAGSEYLPSASRTCPRASLVPEQSLCVLSM